MTPLEKACIKKYTNKEKKMCLEEYVCYDCGNDLIGRDDENHGMTDLYCHFCPPKIRSRKKYLLFGPEIFYKVPAYKGFTSW